MLRARTVTSRNMLNQLNNKEGEAWQLLAMSSSTAEETGEYRSNDAINTSQKPDNTREKMEHTSSETLPKDTESEDTLMDEKGTEPTEDGENQTKDLESKESPSEKENKEVDTPEHLQEGHSQGDRPHSPKDQSHSTEAQSHSTENESNPTGDQSQPAKEQEDMDVDEKYDANDDQEMKSQSSEGTERLEDSEEGEEEKEDENKKVGASDTDKNQVKDKNKTKKQTTGGSSGDDDDWNRPWRSSGTSWGSRKITLPKLSRYSSYDTQQYRDGYPNKEDDPSINHNLMFYTNKRPSYPSGDLVDNIHRDWWGDYDLLEYHHSYIQWLFPIRERGLNWHAQELQPHEIKAIKKDKTAYERVLTSYKMMLDFYGLELQDEKTGEVKRSSNWKDRFQNLNYSGHNYLRITRILKCLGEFDYERFKFPLIKHFLYEAITERTLLNALNSCVSYWIEVVKDPKQREELRSYAEELVDKANSSQST